MFLKGFRVSYPFQHLWSSGTAYKYFLYEDKAKEFHKTANEEAWKTNQTAKLDEVAYVLIEDKAYCLGAPVEVLDMNRFNSD